MSVVNILKKLKINFIWFNFSNKHYDVVDLKQTETFVVQAIAVLLIFG